MMSLRAGAALLILAAGACADHTASDPNGEFDADALPRLVLELEVRVGSIEDPNYGFSHIGSVDVDRDGQIYVFESLDLQIRVYSPDGELVRTIGRRGEGPGEFPSPLVRFGVSGDTLWTWSSLGGTPSSGGRLALFTREGRLLSTAPLQPVLWYDWEGNCAAIVPERMSADGRLMGDRFPAITYAPFCPRVERDEAAGRDTLDVARVRFATDGTVVDTAGFYPVARMAGGGEMIEVGPFRYLVPQPPSAEPLLVNLPDGRYEIDRTLASTSSGGVLRVTRRDFDGDALFARSFSYGPLGYLEATLDSVALRYAPRPGPAQPTPGGPRIERTAADSVRAYEALRRAMSFPRFQPPVQDFHLGSDDALWLRREDTGGETHRWMVLDPRGAPVGEFELPRSGFQVAWSRGDALLAVETDELGIPWLTRYRIR